MGNRHDLNLVNKGASKPRFNLADSPAPKMNVQVTKIAAIIPVNWFKPFSALFCDENNWLAEPIEANPSPFGACKRTKIISNIADKICTIYRNVAILFPFVNKKGNMNKKNIQIFQQAK